MLLPDMALYVLVKDLVLAVLGKGGTRRLQQSGGGTGSHHSMVNLRQVFQPPIRVEGFRML